MSPFLTFSESTIKTVLNQSDQKTEYFRQRNQTLHKRARLGVSPCPNAIQTAFCLAHVSFSFIWLAGLSGAPRRAWGPTERKGSDPFVCVWRAAAAWDCRHAGGRGSLRTPPRAYPERRLNASGLLAPTGRTPAGCPCGAARSLAAPSTHRIGAFAGRPPAEQAR